MSRASIFLAAGFVVFLNVGCQSARFVERNSYSGVVAVPSESDRADALKLIEKSYGKNFIIESEGEATTGTAVNSTIQNGTNPIANAFDPLGLHPDQVTQTSTVTQELKEWQIRFRVPTNSTSPVSPKPSPAPIQQLGQAPTSQPARTSPVVPASNYGLSPRLKSN